MENATKKTKIIRRVELGFIGVAADETPEEAIGYYAGPDGTLRLDKSKVDALSRNTELQCPGARAYRIVAEPVL